MVLLSSANVFYPCTIQTIILLAASSRGASRTSSKLYKEALSNVIILECINTNRVSITIYCLHMYTCISDMHNNIVCYITVIYIHIEHARGMALQDILDVTYWLINLHSICTHLLQTSKWFLFFYVFEMITSTPLQILEYPRIMPCFL